jgi:hypothetical protein
MRNFGTEVEVQTGVNVGDQAILHPTIDLDGSGQSVSATRGSASHVDRRRHPPETLERLVGTHRGRGYLSAIDRDDHRLEPAQFGQIQDCLSCLNCGTKAYGFKNPIIKVSKQCNQPVCKDCKCGDCCPKR